MKKISIFLTILAVLFIFPIEALAVEYSIEKTRIDAYLQENGEVHVTERHTYGFEGEFNGITRSLIPKKETAIVDVSAKEGDQALDVEQQDNEYRVYRSGSDETITVDLSYTIENGIEKYTDVARFDWPFFDQSNESDYNQMDVYVHPPQPTEGVIVYGEDEAAGSESVEEEGVVRFDMGHVDSGKNGNIRTAFDASLFPGAALTEDKAIRGEILAKKEELDEKQAAYEAKKDFFTTISSFIIGAFAIYLLILIIYTVRKRNAVQQEVERRFGTA
ncbi:DUF2207 domain-containing protein [Halomonas sp. MG34]|nr:DUF2207 domain-containing protein [Halomonas sp. MG34]